MIDPRLAEAMAVILGLAPEQITDETAYEITGCWDSIAHINLILYLEEVFDVHFTSDEIPELTTAQRIQSKLAQAGKL